MTADTNSPIIYSIGHSDHEPETLIALLQRHGITTLVDVRSQPYSRWVPHFNRETLAQTLTEADRRTRFLAEHLDRAAEEVLGQHPSRSLCLVRPDRLWAHFTLDPYSLKYEARIGFTLSGACHPQANSSRGLPVTDIKWRALGRSWLGEKGGKLRIDEAALLRRLPAEEVYLALGLSRGFQGKMWLIVIGVHVVPDYQVEIDYRNL